MRLLTSLGLALIFSSQVFGQTVPADFTFFEAKIRPVLIEHCYSCHSVEAQKNKKLKGNLFVDSRDGLRKGGANGPAIAPGKPSESLLLKALRHDELRMPPKYKLLMPSLLTSRNGSRVVRPIRVMPGRWSRCLARITGRFSR